MKLLGVMIFRRCGNMPTKCLMLSQLDAEVSLTSTPGGRCIPLEHVYLLGDALEIPMLHMMEYKLVILLVLILSSITPR